ncbi:MAG: biopolymer transporter ExbD [Treponema sp.]|jgi:biopolymer transport protein ExbD|nr:biopolymer transporter ExbD [Treponema sp.]
MKIKRDVKTASIPTFSLSDVAFLLLIFIMLVSLINYRQEISIDFPEANTALRTNAEKNLEIWINLEGDLFLDGYPSDHLALERKIADLYINAPDTRVHILADRNTPYENINKVLEVLQLLQYRVVSFVVKNNE